MKSKLLKQLFQDDTGRYVIGQPPNIPMYMILTGLLAKALMPDGAARDLVSFVVQASVFLWAYLEIVYGESTFRRALGTVVMTSLLYGMARQ